MTEIEGEYLTEAEWRAIARKELADLLELIEQTDFSKTDFADRIEGLHNYAQIIKEDLN